MESFGKYELLERIGKGGMAEIFLARSVGAQGVEKTLVIKRILPELVSNPRFVEMFIAEAKIAMGLNHPNVVQIFDFGRIEQDYYLAMEYVDGLELSRLLKASEAAECPLAVGNAVYLAMEVARGLDYAHRKKDAFGRPLEIVHRDISPQNVMISREGTVKIVDFGIAKATSVADDGPEVVKGKYRYMSPEQAAGMPLDQRSDIFSLAVVLFEMITGRSLFGGASVEETLHRVSLAVVPDIQAINPEVPSPLEHLVYKALARDPADRYQSARELLGDLTRVLYGLDMIHDATTLAGHLREVENQLPPKTLEIILSGEEKESEGVTVRTRGRRRGLSGETPQLGVGATAGVGLRPLRPAVQRLRKEVVVLYGEFVRLGEEGDQDCQSLVDDAFAIADSVAYKNEAMIRVDAPRGFSLVLGLPLSSETDAERAIRIGMDLQDAVAGLNGLGSPCLGLRLAVELDEVIVERGDDHDPGAYGWVFRDGRIEWRGRFHRQVEPGQILVEAPVFQRVRRNFRGRRTLIPEVGEVYEIRGPKSARDQIRDLRQSFESFYGREIETRLLRDQFREVLRSHRARACLLIGSPGVGKSSLMESFLARQNEREVRIVRAVASPFDSDVPLASAVGLFSAMMKLDLSDSPEELRGVVKRRLKSLFPDLDEDERSWIADPIFDLFGVFEFSGSGMSGEERRRRLFLSLSRITNQLALMRPLILAIDDVHLVDPVMRAFTAQYFDRSQNAPVFFVGTALAHGSHEASRSWQALRKARHVNVEFIEELGQREAEEMVRNRLRIHEVEDEGLVQRVLEHSGGNPLYIKEVIKVLGESGYFEELIQNPMVLEPEELLPASVEGIIMARLDRLDGDAQGAVKRLALLRSPFRAAEAAMILGEESKETLSRLVDEGFLIATAEKEGGLFRFANALTQEVAARCLLPAEAKQLHQKIAIYLQESGQRQDEPLIAWHLDAAGEHEEAIRRYLDSLKKALERYGASECLRLCERVLQHPRASDADRFEALSWRERALREIGEVAEIGETLGELEELAKIHGEPSDVAHVAARKALYLYQSGAMEEARKEAKRSLKIARNQGDKLAMARAWRTEAVIDLTEGERIRALSLVDRAIATLVMTQNAEAREEVVRAYNLRGVILRQSGRHREALDSYETALAGAEALGTPRLVRQLLTNSGLALAFVGQFSEAKRRYLRSLEASRRLGNRREEALVLVNLGHVFQMLGQYEQALRYIRRGKYLAERNGDVTTSVDGMITLGLACMETGNFTDAQEFLSTGLARAEAIPHAYLAVCAILGLAQLELCREEPEPRAAIVHAGEALRRCKDTGMIWGIAMSQQVQAEAYLAIDEVDEALLASRQAVELLEEVDIYGIDQILLTHLDVLAHHDGVDDEEEDVRARLSAIFEERLEGIDDEEDRQAYVNKAVNQRIAATVGSRVLESQGEANTDV